MTPGQRAVVLHFLRAYRRPYAALFVTALAVASLEAAWVFAALPLFGGLLGGSPAAPSGAAGRVLDAALSALPAEDPLVRLCLLLLALTGVKAAAGMFHEYLSARASGRVFYETKKKVLESYARAGYDYFLDHAQGRLSYVALMGTTRLALMMLKVPQFCAEAARAAALLALLAWLDWRITCVLAVFGLTFDRALNGLSRRVSYNFGQGRLEAHSRQSVIFNEFANGVKQLFAFGVKGSWLRRFDLANREYADFYVKDMALLAVPKPAIETAAMTLVLGSILALRWLAPDQGAGRLPLLAVFAVAAMKLLPSISGMSRMRMEILSALPDVEAVYEALTAPVPESKAGGRRFQRLETGIRLEGVHFRYKGREELLRGVDAHFPRRAITAIVGDSGSGKTTVVNLLLGLYAPSAGRIWVDDTELDRLDLGSWLARVAVVTQDTFIFHASVAENIVFGREGHSRAAIERAAGVAQAHEFIAGLPQGYDTMVGERGMKLSGGQQQRLAIARAVLGEPEVLIFDEATSSLDGLSEAAVQAAILEVSKGRTVIEVAHRLSTIRDADNILVLQEGRVAEEGPHDRLLGRNGQYARLLRAREEAAR